jgi:hypothetical protein
VDALLSFENKRWSIGSSFIVLSSGARDMEHQQDIYELDCMIVANFIHTIHLQTLLQQALFSFLHCNFVKFCQLECKLCVGNKRMCSSYFDKSDIFFMASTRDFYYIPYTSEFNWNTYLSIEIQTLICLKIESYV